MVHFCLQETISASVRVVTFWLACCPPRLPAGLSLNLTLGRGAYAVLHYIPYFVLGECRKPLPVHGESIFPVGLRNRNRSDHRSRPKIGMWPHLFPSTLVIMLGRNPPLDTWDHAALGPNCLPRCLVKRGATTGSSSGKAAHLGPSEKQKAPCGRPESRRCLNIADLKSHSHSLAVWYRRGSNED